MAHLLQDQLDAGTSGEDVELVDVPQVGQANDLSFEVVLPVRELKAKLLFELGQENGAVDVCRHLDDRERGVRLCWEQLQAERLKARTGGGGVTGLTGPDVLDPFRQNLFPPDAHRATL